MVGIPGLLDCSSLRWFVISLCEIRHNPQCMREKDAIAASFSVGWNGHLLLAVLMGIYIWQEDRNNHSTQNELERPSASEKDQLVRHRGGAARSASVCFGIERS